MSFAKEELSKSACLHFLTWYLIVFLTLRRSFVPRTTVNSLIKKKYQIISILDTHTFPYKCV